MFIISFSWSKQRRQWKPTPVLLPGQSHGRRSLVGCSSWGRQESDMTERLHFHFSLSHIGEGNGNPLQCSCLENPREGGAWWAALQGVAQSQTRLKQLTAAWSKTIKNSLSPAEFSFWHSRPFIYNPVCVSELIFQVSSNALCACLPASMILFKLVPLIKYLLLPVLPTKLTYSFFFFF